MAWHRCPVCNAWRKVDNVISSDGWHQPPCYSCGDPGYIEPLESQVEEENESLSRALDEQVPGSEAAQAEVRLEQGQEAQEGLDSMSNVDVTRLLKPCALVEAYVLRQLEKTDKRPEFSVYVVWFSFILGGWKALVSTSLPDGMYYEVTHSAVKRETYLDVYKKFDNIKLKEQD